MHCDQPHSLLTSVRLPRKMPTKLRANNVTLRWTGARRTLLEHVLRTADSRIAVVVNDMARLNVDAMSVVLSLCARVMGGRRCCCWWTCRLASKMTTHAKGGDGGVVRLENGCICCSLGRARPLITNRPYMFSACAFACLRTHACARMQVPEVFSALCEVHRIHLFFCLAALGGGHAA